MAWLSKTLLSFSFLFFFSLFADKDTITVGYDAKILNTDPRRIGGGDAGAFYIEALRFAKLVSFNESGDLTYMLIKSVKEKSNTEYEFTLKKGIFFTNGKEIQAADVVATYQSIMNPKDKNFVSPRKSAYSNVKSFEVISPYVIRMKLHDPDAQILTNLVVGILPKELADTPDLKEQSGFESGAYVMKSYNEQEIVLERNDKYTLGPVSKAKRVIFKVIPNAGTRYAAFLRGDVDLIQNSLDFDKFAQIEQQKDRFNTVTGKRLATSYFAFNMKNSFLKERKVREAVAHCINKEKVIKFRFLDQAIIAQNLLVPGTTYYSNKIKTYDFSPEKSKKILSDLKLLGKVAFTFSVSDSSQANIEAAKMFVEDLNKCGFSVSLKTIENATFLQQAATSQFDAWLGAWVGFKDPEILRFAFGTSKMPPNGGNRGLFSYKPLDILLDKGVKEVSLKKRKLIYEQAQKIISEELPYVFLWHGINAVALQKNISGYKPYADGSYTSLAEVEKK